MTTRDMKNNVDVAQSLVPASRTATVNGTGVDLRGYEAAMAVIDRGAIGGTSPSFTFEVQESDDDASYNAVADADLDGTEPVDTSGDAVSRIGYKGGKRYIRVAITAVSGTSPTLLCSVAVMRGNHNFMPVA